MALVGLMGMTTERATAQKKEKVILDTDMVEVFDDGVAMMMLAKAPNIDLLGVTIVIGNTWVPEGTAYGIRQLECVNRTDIPIVPGIRQPIYPNRFETIKNERILFGIGDAYVGAAGYPEPASPENPLDEPDPLSRTSSRSSGVLIVGLRSGRSRLRLLGRTAP